MATVVEVYLWSRLLDGSEVKYSLVNDVAHPLSLKTLLYYQMQQYWVERAFQQTKQQLGMAQYQVRSWKAFSHHLALCLMAFHFIVEQQLLYQRLIPLLSAADIKLLIAQSLSRKIDEQHVMNLIAQRHYKRQR